MWHLRIARNVHGCTVRSIGSDDDERPRMRAQGVHGVRARQHGHGRGVHTAWRCNVCVVRRRLLPVEWHLRTAAVLRRRAEDHGVQHNTGRLVRGVWCRRVPGRHKPSQHGMQDAAAMWPWPADVGGHGGSGALVQRMPGQHVPVVVVSSLDELHCAADVRCGPADVGGYGNGGAYVQCLPGQHVPVIAESSCNELHCSANMRPGSVHVCRH